MIAQHVADAKAVRGADPAISVAVGAGMAVLLSLTPAVVLLEHPDDVTGGLRAPVGMAAWVVMCALFVIGPAWLSRRPIGLGLLLSWGLLGCFAVGIDAVGHVVADSVGLGRSTAVIAAGLVAAAWILIGSTNPPTGASEFDVSVHGAPMVGMHMIGMSPLLVTLSLGAAMVVACRRSRTRAVIASGLMLQAAVLAVVL